MSLSALNILFSFVKQFSCLQTICTAKKLFQLKLQIFVFVHIPLPAFTIQFSSYSFTVCLHNTMVTPPPFHEKLCANKSTWTWQVLMPLTISAYLTPSHRQASLTMLSSFSSTAWRLISSLCSLTLQESPKYIVPFPLSVFSPCIWSYLALLMLYLSWYCRVW